jgi:cell division protein FtsL
MSTVAARPRSSRKAGAAGSGATSRPVLLGGVVWIGVFALLFTGVVALNVIVLRQTVELDELSRQRAQLRADLARLEAELSTAAANVRIAREARERLGLVAADPAATSYVTLAPGGK